MRRLALAVMAGLTLVHPASAQATRRPLPVPATTLYPGDLVLPERLAEKVFLVTASHLKTFAGEARQVAGKEVRRTLAAGQPIALSSVKDPDAVRKGVAAPVRFAVAGLTITATLVPLESAAAGALVQARNPDSGRTVRARALADGGLEIVQP